MTGFFTTAYKSYRPAVCSAGVVVQEGDSSSSELANAVQSIELDSDAWRALLEHARNTDKRCQRAVSRAESAMQESDSFLE